MPPAVAPPDPRNLALDGARGLAIVLILVCHGLSYPAPDSRSLTFVKQLTLFSSSGVELFFILSGFLIGTGLLRTRRAVNQAGVFYVRRACRILPVYALLLGSFFLARENPTLKAAGGVYYFGASVPLWTYFVFIQNNVMGAMRQIGPWWLVITWSLAIEEQFYAVVPWVMRRIGPTVLLAIAVVLVVVCPLLRYILMVQTQNLTGAWYLTPTRIDTLFIGLAVATIWENPAGRARLVALRRPLSWGLAGFLLLFVAGPFTPLGVPPSLIIWMPTLQGLGFAGLLVWILSFPDHAVARVLRLRFWIFMGSISYFAYLFHLPAIYSLHGLLRHSSPSYFDWQGVVATLLAMGVVVVAGMASRRWIEQPFIKLGHRFSYRFS